MGTPEDLTMLGQVLLAFFLGGLIGFEREIHRSPAGLRTYAAVCMGSCVFCLASFHPTVLGYYQSVIDTTRIAGQVVSGIGFIGAGVIFKEGLNTRGLTTAATLWATAAVGMVVAYSMYFVGILTTILILFLLLTPRLPFIRNLSKKRTGAPDLD